MATYTTNVPGITWSDSGFVIPSSEAVLAGEIADIQSAFNNTLNLSISDSDSLTTSQGQLASSNSAIISNNYAFFLYYTQQFDPAYASGRAQDALARIYFLERNPAEPTTLQISCSGLTGVTIPVGATIQDTSGNLYQCTTAAVIASAGSVTTSFACTVPGPTAVPPSNGVSIYQAIPGWDSATVVSGTEGVDTETRQAFEARRADSVAGNSFGAIGSIIGEVAQVSGVTDYYGYNNNTAGSVTVGGVLIGPYSIYICVAGGAESAIANAILSKKGAGAPMVGNTIVTAYDSNPLYASPIPYQITYETPTGLQLLWNVTLVNSPLIPSNATTLVQNALIAAATQGVNGPRARIGQVIYAANYIGAINALGPWALVAAIDVGSANTPGSQFVGTISGATLSVSEIISGTLQVGQTISGTIGDVLTGTVITSLGSGAGGTGTYVINQPQTVAGARFTASGTGAVLTVSVVASGTITIGNVLSGSGIPSNTTILSQQSGTPGGAGVYITSASTTASGSILASENMSGAIANQSFVSVQANQSPQTSAPNIMVGIT